MYILQSIGPRTDPCGTCKRSSDQLLKLIYFRVDIDLCSLSIIFPRQIHQYRTRISFPI